MSASAATAAVSARRIRGPRFRRSTRGAERIAARSSSPKPPSGPIRRPTPLSARAPSRRLEWTGLSRLFVAEDEQPLGRPAFERFGKGLDGRNLRNPDHSALFASLDGIRLQPLQIDARDLGVTRDDRPQPARPHLDRFLRHIIEPGVLERREQIVEVGRRFLGSRLRADDERGRLARTRVEAGGELAVPAIEQKDRSSRAEPQHVDEVVRLLRIELHLGARSQIVRDT